MNGSILGTAEWSGQVPANTTKVSISPVERIGPFNFAIDSVEVLPRWRIVYNAATSRARHMAGVRATMTPIKDYDAWHSRLARPMDLDGIDWPRAEWRSNPVFVLVLRLAGAGFEDLRTTVESLKQQHYPRWLLCAIVDGADSAIINTYREAAGHEPRLTETEKGSSIARLSSGANSDNYIAIIAPGDVLPESSLAIIAETLAAAPGLVVVYGDEDAIGSNGRLHSPKFKPDWSPIFQRGAPYLGRLTCVRVEALDRAGCSSVGEFVSQEQRILGRVLDALSRETVGHVRRLLYRRKSEPTQIADVASNMPANNSDDSAWPEAVIVVPTRDMADLLSECVKGLRQKTDYPHYQVMIVDNGSTKPDALALLNDLRRTPRFTILERPGPFNFSALCNDGARATNAPLLVFLNNDIAMIGNDWLRPLARWAMRPGIGIVGAKLLFPSGLIQHAGVVVGFGGIAGHLYRKERADARGYLDQLLIPHEVSAVTAACFAIARTKFEAVGGFDAEHLPVELNDVDLCLRIAERGWTNLFTPESVLCHREFGSRRIGLIPAKTYGREREYFVERWQHVIRDDPFFHPGLSLSCYRPALAE